MRLGKKSQSKKRHEDILCPLCKRRAFRLFTLDKNKKINRYECKFCGHRWSQQTMLLFTEGKFKNENECVCGGIFEYNRLDKGVMEIWKCNKCGVENTPEAM